MELEALGRRIDIQLANAEAAVGQLAELIRLLRLERDLARHVGTTPDERHASATADWAGMARTDAVLRMLSDVARSISPAELSTLLVAAGRTGDAPKDVSATLSHLRRAGHVQPVDRGRWVAVDPCVQSEVLSDPLVEDEGGDEIDLTLRHPSGLFTKNRATS